MARTHLRSFTSLLALLSIAPLAPLVAIGCGGGSTGAGPSGDASLDGATDVATEASDDAGSDTDLIFDAPADGEACDPPCSPGSFCYANACVQEQPPCTTDNDCQNDSYCETSTKRCLPYGPGGKTSNPDCAAFVPIGTFAPAVLCEFVKTPTGDPFPNHLNVLATATVASFATGQKPSIVAPFYDGMDGSSEQNGILRVLSGSDCTQIAQLGGTAAAPLYVSASSTPAIGDLDGDGKPEIVAYSKPGGTAGSVTAFKRDSGGVWNVLWEAKNADGSPWRVPSGAHEWAGPSIHDLDDDGKPEILREAYVFDATGKLLAGPPAGFSEGYGTGQFPVVADLDGDGKVEMVNGQGIWAFDKTTKQWTPVVASIIGGFAGLTAIADFGTDSVDGVLDGKAEIAVVRGGQVIVETAAGKVVWGPIALPGSAGGGPPTIADFDGDGQAEIAVAGSDSYNVLDPDCQAASVRPGGKCATGATNGVLWSKKSQDHSSNITGSSVFDFDADGVAEAIYADECFARIYSGDTGDVIFSQYMSSCTWYENPIVADVNNDDRAELIVGSNLNCPPTPGATTGRLCETGEVVYPDSARPSVPVDAVFAGLRCKQAGDCVSGVCDNGYCRCTADAQCCPDKDDAKCMEVGFICMPAPAGTPGTGKTCRAAHPHGRAGIRVYKDFADRWVRSRPIWNQHAYSITNVNDDGTIPKTSAWQANWKHTGPRYNDFRKNTPGTNDPLKAPDLTAKGSQQVCSSSGAVTLSVQVCNRGATKAGDNYSVTFQSGTTVICTAKTTMPLDVGACQTLSCDWTNPPKSSGAAQDVTVVVDAEGHVRQCNKDNNKAMIPGVYCGIGG
jgi:hypothetical protein